MTLAVDASAVVAALVDTGPDGRWAEELLASDALVGPHLLPVEVDNVLRRAAAAGQLSPDAASLAHSDLIALRIELFAYEPFASRAWELRGNVTSYDAWYVALAEWADAPLATLDRRLATSPNVGCRFLLPPRTNVGP